MMRPSFNLFFLMYSQTFLVTSVRGIFLPPQMLERASDNCFGAKMPFPAFFMAIAFFLPVADCAVLPNRRFSAVIFFNAAFVIVVVFVATVVFVVVVMAIEG